MQTIITCFSTICQNYKQNHLPSSVGTYHFPSQNCVHRDTLGGKLNVMSVLVEKLYVTIV